MHLIVALDGPVAFSYPNPINQPKPGSQEQLQVLPSHHLRAQDVLNSSQKRNWEEKSFTFPSESSEEGAWILVFWAKWAKNILKLNVEPEWLEYRGKKTGWKQVFLWYWLKYCQHSPSDENFRSKASRGWVWSCFRVLLWLHGFFSKPVIFFYL